MLSSGAGLMAAAEAMLLGGQQPAVVAAARLPICDITLREAEEVGGPEGSEVDVDKGARGRFDATSRCCRKMQVPPLTNLLYIQDMPAFAHCHSQGIPPRSACSSHAAKACMHSVCLPPQERAIPVAHAARRSTQAHAPACSSTPPCMLCIYFAMHADHTLVVVSQVPVRLGSFDNDALVFEPSVIELTAGRWVG